MTCHVFIIGSKGIPARYGGFETFVEKLTQYSKKDIQYHIACISKEHGSYTYNHAECIKIKVPDIGAAKAVYYDCAALEYFIKYCKEHKEIELPVFYILACRIGPFIGKYYKEIHKLRGKLYVNPDGHEWKRGKWSKPVQIYWKISERRMVRAADQVICDSRAIEYYIRTEYAVFSPKTSFIPYGAEKPATDNCKKLQRWFEKYELEKMKYYILVGRFVKENNFETIIREFMMSDTKRKLLIITGKNDKLSRLIRQNTGCDRDHRIIFGEAVYDEALLYTIRRNAYGSFHGHEVGGTNPSLLEGLMCTKLNLVLDVVFNREVCQDAALYWNKEAGNLKALLEYADKMPEEHRVELGEKAILRIETEYNWKTIAEAYRGVFLNEEKNGFCGSV